MRKWNSLPGKFASGSRNITLATRMATIGSVEPFNPDIGELWSQYVDRLN